MRTCPHCGAENNDYSTYCSKCWEDVTKPPEGKSEPPFEPPAAAEEIVSRESVFPRASGTQDTQRKEEIQKLEDALKHILTKETSEEQTGNAPPLQDALFGKKPPLPAGIKPAGFTERVQAMLVDGCVLVFINVLVRVFGMGLPVPSHTLALLISPVYFTVFISRFGQTPGKWFMGLKVVSEDGRSPVTMERAFIRWLGYAVNMFFFGLGYLWIFIDPNRQGFHDKMAKTVVIKVK